MIPQSNNDYIIHTKYYYKKTDTSDSEIEESSQKHSDYNEIVSLKKEKPMAIKSPNPNFGNVYELLNILSSGHDAEVYQAFCMKKPNQVYAIKVSDASKKSRKKQQQEGRFVSYCNSLNIPGVITHVESFPFEVARDDFFCSVYLMGPGTLQEKVNKTRCSLSYIQHIGRQILTTLEHFAQKQLVYANLSQKNVVIIYGPKNEDVVQLIGFRTSFFEGDYQGEQLQSYSYRAPEIVVGTKAPTVASDIWSLGVMLTELFWGKALFEHTEENEYEDDYDLENTHLYRDMTALFGSFPTSMQPIDQLPVSTPKRDLARMFQHKLFKEIPQEELLQINPTELMDFEDLIHKMLVIDPARRLCPMEALSHPFFSQREISPLSYPPSLLPLPVTTPASAQSPETIPSPIPSEPPKRKYPDTEIPRKRQKDKS